MSVSSTSEPRIRAAERADVPLLLGLVRALAEYERAPEMVTGTEPMLEQALFGEHPVAEGLIAEIEGEPVGFAIFYTTFSTWQCRAGLWLEDLFVVPGQRRAGVGRRLLEQLAAIAADRSCGRLEWSALNWNTPAIDFYLGLGAKRMVEWNTFRLEGPALARVAGSDMEKPRRSGASR